MILQSLVDYYDRKTNADSALAPDGFESKEIPFLIVLDVNGRFVSVEDTRQGEGKKKRAKSYIVPQGVKKTSGVASNLLWDTVEYVFGAKTKQGIERTLNEHKEPILEKTGKYEARLLEQHAAFNPSDYTQLKLV